MSGGSSGSGIAGAVACVIGASIIITLVTGDLLFWLFVLAGIFVGVLAASAIE
jgi:hypothetical protein